MKLSQQFRRKGNRARSALVLVVVAIFNLAFQQCAMATDMDEDHPCPHCPTETGQEQHHRDVQLNLAIDCDFDDTYSHESRTAQFKSYDKSDDSRIFLPGEWSPGNAAKSHVVCSRAPPVACHSSGPPLNELHCVYLI